MYNLFVFILEIARAQNTNGKPESAYLDINSDKPIRLTAKIMVPAKEFPRVFIFNILIAYDFLLYLFLNYVINFTFSVQLCW